MAACQIDQGLAQGDRKRDRKAQPGHPNAVNEVERFDAFRQRGGNNQCNFSVCGALVFAQFGEPDIAPSLGAFGFPQYGTAELADRTLNALKDVAAELTFGHRLNQISGKTIA